MGHESVYMDKHQDFVNWWEWDGESLKATSEAPMQLQENMKEIMQFCKLY